MKSNARYRRELRLGKKKERKKEENESTK